MTNIVTTSAEELYQQLKAGVEINHPTMHDKFRGDAGELVKKLQRAGIHRRQINDDLRGRHERISVKLLQPLDSQRNVTDNWIYKVLKLAGGFDWVAMGLVFVARDPQTKINYVWDGCGRLALAQANGIPELDCWVMEMTQQKAAHYFVHVQKTAKRTLDPNIIFCNAYAHGDESAVAMADTLESLGMRVQGADDVWVPDVPAIDLDRYPRVKLRAVEQAFKYAEKRRAIGSPIADIQTSSDTEIVAMARNTIVQAGWDDDQIRQDLLPGLVIFYSVYPEAMRNGLNKMIFSWFQGLAQVNKQAKLTFKQTGGNQHNREAESVAMGIVKELQGSPKFNAGHAMAITQKRMKSYLTWLANKNHDLDDEFSDI